MDDNAAAIPGRELGKLLYGKDSVFARNPTPEQVCPNGNCDVLCWDTELQLGYKTARPGFVCVVNAGAGMTSEGLGWRVKVSLANVKKYFLRFAELDSSSGF